jgi:hypothetical protein
MIFSVFNRRLGILIYAGVQSFVTEPGQCSLPYWMMEYLKIDYRDIVDVSLITTTLPLATRAIFQPADAGFFTVPDPKKLLEERLRVHPCLTQGTVLTIPYHSESYRLKVLKTEPQRVVSTIDADVVCDFATPLSQFQHSWFTEDTDSSDDGQCQLRVGFTAGGAMMVEQPGPMRSTYVKREQDRARGVVQGVTMILDGKEILPPKPREEPKPVKRPEPRREDAFRGTGRVLGPG